jgi:hypothetical protein
MSKIVISYVNPLSHSPLFMNAGIHAHKYMHTCIHTYMHIFFRMWSCRYMHLLIHTYRYTCICKYIYIQARWVVYYTTNDASESQTVSNAIMKSLLAYFTVWFAVDSVSTCYDCYFGLFFLQSPLQPRVWNFILLTRCVCVYNMDSEKQKLATQRSESPVCVSRSPHYAVPLKHRMTIMAHSSGTSVLQDIIVYIYIYIYIEREREREKVVSIICTLGNSSDVCSNFLDSFIQNKTLEWIFLMKKSYNSSSSCRFSIYDFLCPLFNALRNLDLMKWCYT